ncbi:hypothetical protein L6164_037394 [Bauhinia variegata]|uniref:Uncharacterized protein n=1 Tax=Bauhinia variegata TaxID=167791 RepID=A0ACB9KJR2_BAUVA|nr:hypothetical protein L6164_037394 [Bauhinia variegata]
MVQLLWTKTTIYGDLVEPCEAQCRGRSMEKSQQGSQWWRNWTRKKRGKVCHANVPWMIHSSRSGTDEHIELSMWLRALTTQAQRHNYQGRALPLS